MSNEKSGGVVDETSHGITPSSDVHYPIVAEGTGKTLDAAAGAKAKEVHNVGILHFAIRESSELELEGLPAQTQLSLTFSQHSSGRTLCCCSRIEDRKMEQELHQALLCSLRSFLLCLCQRLRWLSHRIYYRHEAFPEPVQHKD